MSLDATARGSRIRRPRLPVIALAASLVSVSIAGAAPTQDARPSRRARLFLALQRMDVRDLQGRRWTRETLRGRVTLIDFWATWCAPCLRELPTLQRAQARYGEEFRLLGVSLDERPAPELRTWLQGHGVDWPQVRAPGGFDDPLAVAFAVDRLPSNLLLDRQGRIRALDLRGARLLEQIERLLAEAPDS